MGVLSRMEINKKAAMDLSVRWIVIIIIALVVLLLILLAIRTWMGEAEIRMEEELKKYAVPPTPVISSPRPSDIHIVFQDISFDGSQSYDLKHKIKGFYWDIDADNIIDHREESFIDYYFEPGEYNITLKVINDQGAIGSESQIVRVYTNNTKDWRLLENSALFIKDTGTNQRDMLRLIPVGTWYDISGLHRIPYNVYYDDDGITSGQIKSELISDEKAYAFIFDDPGLPCLGWDEDLCTMDGLPAGLPCCDLGDGYQMIRVDNLESIYFAFWYRYEHVVMVNTEDDNPASLIASLFAAFYNAPIFFIDAANYAFYEPYIRVGTHPQCKAQFGYYIPSYEAIEQDVKDGINTFLTTKAYAADDLRDVHRRVNRIIELHSNVTIES